MNSTAERYVPRHASPVPGQPNESARERARIHAGRAERAVVVLAATDTLPASRLLYRELLRKGALLADVPTGGSR